jgi:serine/threonine-protein kinase
MAPEMLGCDATAHPLSTRTDVYLLGGILHEIITGRAPHASISMATLVTKVLGFTPEFPDDARAELVAICARALESDPSARYESVAALRRAVQDFLQVRSSAHVADQALRSLSALEERISAVTPTNSGTISTSNQQRDLYHLFGECRFGFKAALGEWPQNLVAREGLRRASIMMINHELRARDLKAAATLLAQLEAPPVELREAVEALERDTELARHETQKLALLARDLDLHRGQRVRVFLTLLIGSGFAVTPLLRDPAITAVSADERLHMILWPALFLALTLVASALTRRHIQTAINRRFLGAVILALVAQILVHIAGMLLDLPIHAVHTMLFGLWFCICAMLTITTNPRLVFATLGFLAGFLVSARWPEQRFYAMSAANLLMILNSTVLWHRSRRAPRERRSARRRAH